jgi:hypothetical protein
LGLVCASRVIFLKYVREADSTPNHLIPDACAILSATSLTRFVYTSLSITMPEPKTKKPAAKRTPKAKAAAVALAANSPAPCPPCEPEALSGPISVRYAGPTSHPSHHHMKMAAENGRHTWAAAVIAGLAVVITVSVAYSAVQAASETRTAIRQTVGEVQILRQIGALREKMDQVEQKVDAMSPEQAVKKVQPSEAAGEPELYNAP